MVAQSLKLFLAVIAVLTLAIRARTANRVQDEHVITATNTSLGVKVTVLSKIRRRQQHVLTFENHSLSSGCGPQFWRCQNVLVKRYPILRQYVVFVPLENAIAILDFRYREDELLLHTYYVMPLSLTEVSCNPVGVFDILRSTYVVCLSSSDDLVVYEIMLTRTQITNTLRRRLTSIRLSDSPNLLSNIIFISLGNSFDQKHLFFTVGIYVYKITPHEYVIQMVGTLKDSGIISVPCTIAAAAGQTMIANCEQGAIYFDLTYGQWINQTTYAEYGRPFICPNPDVRLAVFPDSYVQYGLWSRDTRENINVSGLEFDSGVCFGTQNRTLFAYIDRDDGVYILDPLTSNFTQLSSKGCLNGRCDPLLIFDNKYIVLRERNDSTIIVVDSKLSHIIEATDLSADLVAMIPYLEVTILSTSTTEGTASTSTITTIGGGNSNPRDSLKPGSKGVVAIAVPLVIVCLVIFVIFTTATAIWRHRTAAVRVQQLAARNPLGQNDAGRRPSVEGGNAAAEPENILGEGEDLDIDYPINEWEGSDASAVGSTASTVGNSHRDHQSEVATPTSLRREEHRPEGTSNEDLDVTASTVTCSDLGHPSSWSACDGVFCASITSRNGSITSQSGDQQTVAPCLESVQETEESFVESSQSDASDTMTASEPHTDDVNSLPHAPPSVAPIGTSSLPPDQSPIFILPPVAEMDIDENISTGSPVAGQLPSSS